MEDSIFFPALHGLAPSFRGRLEQLAREHDVYRGRLDEWYAELARGQIGAIAADLDAFAAELGEHNVRVNTISGGPLRTLAASAVGGIGDMLDRTPERAPLKRNVEGSDVGGTAVWLLSDLAAGVTGENVYVDCGVNTIGA